MGAASWAWRRVHASGRSRLRGGGEATTAWLMCGLDVMVRYAADRGDGLGNIEVANLSLGGTGASISLTVNDPLRQAFCDAVAAGVTIVVAAGNDAADAKDVFPAAYPEVIAVSAFADFDGQPGGGAVATCRSDVDDTFADFSNFGPDVDIAAPGVCIRSTLPGGGYGIKSDEHGRPARGGSRRSSWQSTLAPQPSRGPPGC